MLHQFFCMKNGGQTVPSSCWPIHCQSSWNPIGRQSIGIYVQLCWQSSAGQDVQGLLGITAASQHSYIINCFVLFICTRQPFLNVDFLTKMPSQMASWLIQGKIWGHNLCACRVSTPWQTPWGCSFEAMRQGGKDYLHTHQSKSYLPERLLLEGKKTGMSIMDRTMSTLV